ncbi:MAG: CoA-binding protein [Candidatus Bathyarchaeia archaeon]
MSQEAAREILKRYRTVAVVGLSRDVSKDSYRVASYLKSQGFRIIPVNPSSEEILGEKCYKSLMEMPVEVQKTIEIVNVFRPSAEALPIVKQAIELKEVHGKPHVVWMQLGVVNEEAAETAKRAGLAVVMDRCMMLEHKALMARHERV